MHPIEFWFVHPEQQVCDIFAKRFADLPSVRFNACSYNDLPPHDCFVTAGNSYGIMTAGIDAAVVNFFGKEIMDKVQFKVLDEYLGEQPIGTAFVVPTSNSERPFVCHTPTMRTPGSIDGTDKVYTATWAALLSIYNHNARSTELITTVCFPAMGCGFGNVSYDESARQMAVAYEHFINLPHRTPDWEWVVARQKKIFYDGKKKVCN